MSFEIKIPKGELIELEKEFSNLKSIDERMNFWLDKLKIPYYMWSHYPQTQISNFMIEPKKKNEIEEINKKVLEQIEYRRGGNRKKRTVFNFEEMKEDFLELLEKSQNKSALIEREKERIKVIREEQCVSKPPAYAQGNFFTTCFDNYFINNEVPDYSKMTHEYQNLVAMNNGFVIAKYLMFLNELLEKPITTKKEEPTHILQMMILHYLGIGKGIENNTQKAEFYSTIIRRDVNKTRQMFSNFSDGETEKNFNFLIDFFTKYGFKKEAQLVKYDLNKKFKKK